MSFPQKTVSPTSQSDIPKSVTSRKPNTRIETPGSFNITRQTHDIPKVSNKVVNANTNRVLHKDFLKQALLLLVIHFKNLLTFHMSSVSSPDIIGNLCLNTRKQPHPTITI